MSAAKDFGFLNSAPVVPRGARILTDGQRRRRLIGNVVFAIVFSIIAIAWFVTLRPTRMGGTASFVMVQGTSMVPTYHTGDLIITHRQPSYAVGDVIAYHVPDGDIGAGLTVIHRIIGGSPGSGFVTKGDGNPTPDDWRPSIADVQGRAWLVVPAGGKVLAFLHAPIPLAGMAAAGVVMWIVYQEETPSLRRRRSRVYARQRGGQGPPLPTGGILLRDHVEDERVLGSPLTSDEAHSPAGVLEHPRPAGDGHVVVVGVVERSLDGDRAAGNPGGPSALP